jgi:hypothetical protein
VRLSKVDNGSAYKLRRFTATGNGNSPDRAAAALAAALSAKDLSPLPFVGTSGTAVNDLFQPVVAGMGPLKPGVTVASVSRDGSSATARLSFSWTFPGVPEQWIYQTDAQLVAAPA